MNDYKKINKLQIYRQNVLVGTLSRTANGCALEFDPTFLNNADFAGLLPEGLRLKSIQSDLKTSQDDLFSLFAATGAHAIGDVYALSKSLKQITHEAPKLKQIDFYQYFFKLNQINSYAMGEDAIAGVQEKISASMISFPLNIAKANKQYILKLNPKDKPNLIENEFYCLKLANKCGIKTAKAKLVFDKNKNSGLLVERFDRVWIETNKQFKMIHQEDACQILNLYPAEKYRVSVNEMVVALKEVLSTDVLATLKLVQQIAFSYLIGNGDLHAKNISVYTTETGFTDLTPSYDLICTLIYGDQKMALKMDGRDTNFKRKHFIDFASRHGVDKRLTEKMLDKLLKAMKENYTIISQIPMPKKKWDFLESTIKRRIADLKG
jgi:serine/threonine-protein kinase HipA